MKWASWFNVLFGAWLIIAPWVLGYASSTATGNDVVLGIAILLVGFWSVSVPAVEKVPAWINLVLGVWLLFAPWILAYGPLAGGATGNDVTLGILTIVFATIRIATARRVTTTV